MNTPKKFAYICLSFAVLLIFVSGLLATLSFDPAVSSASAVATPTADYSVDFYAGAEIENFGLTDNVLTIWGPDIAASYGDAFSCANVPYATGCDETGIQRFGLDLPFQFTYRIDIPDSYQGLVTEALTPTHIVRVEILDPDTKNDVAWSSTGVITHSQAFLQATGVVTTPYQTSSSYASSMGCLTGGGFGDQQCVINTCEWGGMVNHVNSSCHLVTTPFSQTEDLAEVNPLWFASLDDVFHGESVGTETRYQLYYYWLNPSTNLVEKKVLATYYGQSLSGQSNFEMPSAGSPYHVSTDMQWVSPGAYNRIGSVPTVCDPADSPNGGYVPESYTQCSANTAEATTANLAGDTMWGRGFEVDLLNDLPHIVLNEENSLRSLYVDVQTLSGRGENGYQLWAGPPHAHFGMNSDVNVRNLQLRDDPGRFSAEGISIYSENVLSLNGMSDQVETYPLMYVSPDLAGQLIELELFDHDVRAQFPITFAFDTIDTADFQVVYSGEDVDPDGVDRTISGGSRCLISSFGCNGYWIAPSFFIRVPDYTADCDPQNPDPYICTPFTGGNLMVSHQLDTIETYQWYAHSLPRADVTPHATLPIPPTATPRSTAYFSTPTSTPTATPSPCDIENGYIPGIIQMEDFDCGGNGYGYNDLDPEANTVYGSLGVYRVDEGVDIGMRGSGYYVLSGSVFGGETEWTDYTVNVSTTDIYNVSIHYASNTARRGRLFVDGVLVSNLEFVNSGSGNTYTDLVVQVALAAGSHTIRVETLNDQIKLDYMMWSSATNTPTPSNTPTATPSSTPTATPSPTPSGPTPTPVPFPSPIPSVGALVVYSDGYATDWSDSGSFFVSTTEFDTTSTVSGTYALKAAYTNKWGQVRMITTNDVDYALYDGLGFFARAETPAEQLEVVFKGELGLGSSTVTTVNLTDQWQYFEVPFVGMENFYTDVIERIEFSPVGRAATIYFDEVHFYLENGDSGDSFATLDLAGDDLQLSWTAEVGCTYDLYELTDPYALLASAIAEEIESPYMITHRTGQVDTNYYYVVGIECASGTVYSSRMGAFDFALTAGE